MTLTKKLMIGLVLAIVSVAGESIYQQRVIADAQRHLDVWLNGKDESTQPLSKGFEMSRVEQSAPGVTNIDVLEAEWKHVEFRIRKADGKSLLVSADYGDRKWIFQGLPIR